MISMLKLTASLCCFARHSTVLTVALVIFPAPRSSTRCRRRRTVTVRDTAWRGWQTVCSEPLLCACALMTSPTRVRTGPAPAPDCRRLNGYRGSAGLVKWGLRARVQVSLHVIRVAIANKFNRNKLLCYTHGCPVSV